MEQLIPIPDPAAPILLFDSGVGGLSVLAEVAQGSAAMLR